MKRTPSSGSMRAALAFSGVLVLCAAAGCGSRGEERTETPAPVAAPAAPGHSTSAASPASPAPAVAGFDRLTGRWLRADGGYVLEIRSVAPDGKVDVAYLNPRPIHVARAAALREEDALALFVELRDVNYPGSTYHLVYDPGRDVLVGRYFQAFERQTFDVEFVRR